MTAFHPGHQAAVLAQLERILSSVAFRNSKRDSSLFRHLVERAVTGNTADFRERALGAEVFGRPAEYDNNSDPIVRVSAGEIRKRIARYYHEPGHEREIRIELPLGSYIPEFLDPAPIPDGPFPVVAGPTVPVDYSPAAPRNLYWVLLCAGLLAVTVAAWRPWVRSDAYDQFWRPFLNSGSPVTICLARAGLRAQAESPAAAPDLPAAFAWPDAVTSTKVACALTAAGQQYQLKRDNDVTFEDLRYGPAVLIGAFNDIWTLRLTENLRFKFQNEGALRWIRDGGNPSTRLWSMDFSEPSTANRDYAVVSRLLTSRSGKPVLTIAGIRSFGTQIAGEFVTNRLLLNELAAKAPAGWQDRNVQFVIGTEIIDGHAGPPTIEAIHVW